MCSFFMIMATFYHGIAVFDITIKQKETTWLRYKHVFKAPCLLYSALCKL